MKRPQALSDLTEMIDSIHLDHPVRVGIDGVDASGKTVLAGELADSIYERGRIVIRVSVDDFHSPRSKRYRQGRYSPQGFYNDSYNYNALLTHVLKPLGPDGNLLYKPVVYDLDKNVEVSVSECHADPTAVLIVDGIFLHRPELREYWDFSIFVHSDFQITTKRAQVRDLHLFKTPDAVRRMYEKRYIPGQRIYLKAVDPYALADVVWNNNDFDYPDLRMNESDNRKVKQKG